MATTTRTRVVTLLATLSVVVTTLTVAPAEAAVRARSAPEQQAEAIVLALHGEARANPSDFGYEVPGVSAVTGYTDIREVARAWADRQAAERRMFHNPDFSRQLCCWTRVGENVAYITLRSLDDAVVEAASRKIFQAWMDSPEHRENILEAAYDQIGLGVSITPTSAGYTMYLTANFRTVKGTPSGTAYGPQTTTSNQQDSSQPAPYDTAACPDGEYDRGSFGDVLTGAHAGAIDCMAWWGIIRTTDAVTGGFAPNDVATRGFMAAVIDRLATAAERPLPAPSRDHFGDDQGHRYERAIDRVAEAGITGGFPDGSFRPDASLTRAQMATFLARAYRDWLALSTPRSRDAFDDDDASVHEHNIDVVAALGIAYGTAERTFSPGRSLSRGQLASFAARTSDRLVAAGVATP